MALTFWILFFLQFVGGNGLLLGTPVSPTSPIAAELQQILNIFHNETTKLQQYVAVLERKMIDGETTLNLKLNKSEEQVYKLSTELQAEKTKRMQLQRDSDDLVFKFFNLSLGYNTITSKTHLLQNENTVLKNGILKLQKDNDDLVLKFFNLSLNYNSIASKANLIQNENTVMKNDIRNLTGVLSGVNFSSIMLDHTQLQQIQQKQGFDMGFSASYPRNASVDTVTFTNVTTNIGNLYNSTSGRFTCTVPGLYYFSLTIVKMNEVDHAWCYIRKNGQRVVQSGISGVFGWIGATNSVILHLLQGDFVDVGGCSSANSPNTTMFTDSSFTGFSVKVD